MPAQPVDATPPGINLSSKGGVHDVRETMEAVFGSAGRYVEPLESWAVLTCDWSSAGQGPCGHSASVGASWGNRSGCSSPFATGAHPGRARRHLPRNRQRQLDAGHRPTSASRLLHSRPGSQACGAKHAFWPPTASCKRSLRVNWCRTGRRNKFRMAEAALPG